MTILGAFDCGDYLLFASDSLATDSNIPYEVVKYSHRADPQMVWWFSGSETIGAPFNWWMQNELVEDNTKDWETFIIAANNKVVELNENRMSDAKRVLLNPERFRSDLISVLLVGYLDGKPDILEIGDDGSFQRHGDIKSAFVGEAIAKTQAVTALRTLQSLDDNQYPLNAATLQKVMEIVAANNTHCAGPIHMFQLSQSGMKDVSQPEMAHE